MRHFKVDYKWNKRYTSEEFKIACNEYNTSNILKQDVEIEFINTENNTIYISELSRSKDTLKILNIDLKPYKTSLMNEVLIEPFINSRIRLPTSIWMLVGRIQWYFNSKKQPETRFETNLKIEKLINLIDKEQNDVLLIGHGFYFAFLKKRLRKKFSGRNKSIFKNGEIVMLQKIVRN